jgi:hypothetical protein
MTSPHDFGDIGAEAYPGRLGTRWGAELVEPPGVRAIRGAAGARLVALSDLAAPHYGIPTRSVHYFCLEEVTDADQLTQYGIVTGPDRRRLALLKDGRGVLHVIERLALKPIIRRPAVLEGRILVSADVADPWRLFSVQMDLDEIRERRLEHVLAYLEYGTRTDFRGGPRRRGGVVSERANVAVRARWWSVTTMPEGPGRIAWPIGRGSVLYVPELPEGVVVPNNFMVSSPPAGLARPRLLAAVANLSWTHVMAETFGRRSAGDGVLLTYLRELNALPIPDPTRMTEGEADELLGLYSELAEQPVLSVTEELQRPERQRFDSFGMTFLVGAEQAADAADVVASALLDLAGERLVKAAMGREYQNRARRRAAFDPEPIAARVIEVEGRPPDFRVLLGEIDATAITSVVLDIPGHPRAERVAVGASLLDQCGLLVNGMLLYGAPTPAHALALQAAISTDPDLVGPVVLPQQEQAAHDAVERWEAAFHAWRERVTQRVGTMLPGATRVQRRHAVLASLEGQANLVSGLLR